MDYTKHCSSSGPSSSCSKHFRICGLAIYMHALSIERTYESVVRKRSTIVTCGFLAVVVVIAVAAVTLISDTAWIPWQQLLGTPSSKGSEEATANWMDISRYRSLVLSASVRNYNQRQAQVSPPPLKTLPVLNSSTHNQHRAWHEYIGNIYGQDFFDSPPRALDLNTFTWFYWNAPLQDQVQYLHLADWFDDRPRIESGTPWTGGKLAWTWGPEHLTRRMGFFVWRPPSLFCRSGCFRTLLKERNFEVLRIGPNEFSGGYEKHGEAWFFHTIGSGIFLRLAGKQQYASADIRTQRSCKPKTERKCLQTMSAPRIELVVRHGGRKNVYWPSELQFLTADGHRCENDFNFFKFLACRNMVLPIWNASRDHWHVLALDTSDMNSDFLLTSGSHR